LCFIPSAEIPFEDFQHLALNDLEDFLKPIQLSDKGALRRLYYHHSQPITLRTSSPSTPWSIQSPGSNANSPVNSPINSSSSHLFPPSFSNPPLITSSSSSNLLVSPNSTEVHAPIKKLDFGNVRTYEQPDRTNPNLERSEWLYVDIRGQKMGPASLMELVNFYKAGKLNYKSLISNTDPASEFHRWNETQKVPIFMNLLGQLETPEERRQRIDKEQLEKLKIEEDKKN